MDEQPRLSRRPHDKKKKGKKKTTQDADRRVSVGEVLGLTPRKPKGANLGEARALDAAEAERKQLKKKLKQRIHELEQQIALPKIKPATPPRLVKQALIAGIASLCSPPKPYDA